MCKICSEYSLGKLTWREAMSNLEESSSDKEHKQNLLQVLLDDYVEELDKKETE